MPELSALNLQSPLFIYSLIAMVGLLFGMLITALYWRSRLQQQQHANALLAKEQEQHTLSLTNALTLAEKQQADLQSESHHLGQQLNQSRSDHAVLRARSEQMREQLNEKSQNEQHWQTKYEGLQQDLHALEKRHAELTISLKEREASLREQIEHSEAQKNLLKKEFENIANKIFEEKNHALNDNNTKNITSLLTPFREQISQFQKRVDTIHSESIKENTSLNNEIKKVLDIGLKMTAEANNLSTALKGNAQQRGAWGEAQLKRTLEISGLVENDHYEAQTSFKDSEGKYKQTDYLIKLPDNKQIIIDSKVSLIAYDKAIAADTPELADAALAEHNKAVKKHIDELAGKDYTNAIGVHSPSFVLMFMPVEPAYIEALKFNKDLFNYGYEKNIVLVSHTTLIPILRTVANLWMMERSSVEAREISEKAGDIYNQVCAVAERLQKLGGTLNTVSNHYNHTVKALVGQQGLHGKVSRFNQLSSKVSKTMPELDPLHLDFETDRLALVAEPISEDAEAVEEKHDEPTVIVDDV